MEQESAENSRTGQLRHQAATLLHGVAGILQNLDRLPGTQNTVDRLAGNIHLIADRFDPETPDQEVYEP